MTKFILVRHGESEGNAQRFVGTLTTKLTEKGIEQAKITGNLLKDHNVKMVACSTYLRAQQTAEIIAGELGIDIAHIKIIEELGERKLGTIEGKPNIWATEWFFTSDNEFGTESRQALLDRMIIALEKIKAIAPTEGKLVVVGHGISSFYMRQAAAGKRTLADFDKHEQMDNAGFMEIEI